jgi:hypothetical protein
MRALRSPKLTAALVILSAVVLWLAAAQIYRFSRLGMLVPAAYRLDSGVPTNSADIRALVPVAETVVDENLCQADFLKSGYTILMAALDLENQDSGYDGWAAAMGRAEAYGRHALGCSPTNGSFWLKLAMLHQAVGEQPHEIAELVGNSQLYGPAEAGVVAGRYAFYNRITNASRALLAPVIERDIRVICSQSGNTVRDLIAAPTQPVERLLKAIAPQCVIPSKPA